MVNNSTVKNHFFGTFVSRVHKPHQPIQELLFLEMKAAKCMLGVQVGLNLI
jgi:hypothetical protein